MKKINHQILIERLKKNGWSPVPYKHHPEHIKKAIKAAKFRPAAKQCFLNAQRLVLMQHEVPLTYVEGIVANPRINVPFTHAWVKDEEGVCHDVTIGNMYPVLYCQEYSKESVWETVLNTEFAYPINEYDLDLRYKAIMLGLDVAAPKEVIEESLRKRFEYLNSLNDLNI
jgi:hypothetical protein